MTNPNSRPTRRLARARATLVANASHDLRTPLNTVLGMAEMLALTELSPRQAAYVSAIRRAGGEMIELIDAALEVTDGAEAPSPVDPIRPATRALADKCLLVVDDSDESEAVLRAFLAETGASIVRARDGVEALAELARGRFDVVLMDMHLPGMDGLATTRAIRRAERLRGDRSVPIVALSADSSSHAARRALAAGCATYVTKPTERATLIGAIVDHVAGPPSALSQLLPKFVSNRERDLVVLDDALASGDFEAIAEIAHKLHGSGASFGFPELSAMGRDLEAAAREGGHEPVARCLERLAELVGELRTAPPASSRTHSATRVRVPAPEKRATPLVLIVDDFADSRAMYTECLEGAGFEVVEAADGHDAVERALSLSPSVVVMDLALPGMDGLEAIRILKGDDRTRSSAIIALTGRTSAGYAESAEDVGCDAFLTKPCLPSTLLDKVRELVASTPPPAAASGTSDV